MAELAKAINLRLAEIEEDAYLNSLLFPLPSQLGSFEQI